MKLEDMVNRNLPPLPWAEGEKIPWDDPAFSERMLREHLSQDHDMASRRQQMIDLHVSWIHEMCLKGRSSRILDLACGPGLYLQRLARLGHTCVGIDFSPASVRYAASQAASAKLRISYALDDIRVADYGKEFDLVLLVFGEFNVFKSKEAEALLEKIHHALKPEGHVILEPQTYDAIDQDGKRAACWHTASAGLFSPTPHIWLEEHFWHADCHAATTRYFIVDAVTGAVDRYASTSQAYTDDEYKRLLANAGFHQIQRFPSLAGSETYRQKGLFALKAQKK